MIVMVGLLECVRIRMRFAGIVTVCICACVAGVTLVGACTDTLEGALTAGLASAAEPCVANAGAMKPAPASARLALSERSRRFIIKRISRVRWAGRVPV